MCKVVTIGRKITRFLEEPLTESAKILMKWSTKPEQLTSFPHLPAYTGVIISGFGSITHRGSVARTLRLEQFVHVRYVDIDIYSIIYIFLFY